MRKARKLGRKTGQRKALLKGLAANLILKGKIQTTEAKAKEVRPFVEKLITKAKTKNFNTMRHVTKFLPQAAVKQLFNEVAPKYAERSGGYTRIAKLGRRKTDSAKMAIIEFV